MLNGKEGAKVHISGGANVPYPVANTALVDTVDWTEMYMSKS